MSATQSRYRSNDFAGVVIGFSISYEHDDLLSRGLGIEHLRELLLRLGRPILRHGANLAYGGNWKETDDNFTYSLLRLVSAEQEDNSMGGPDTSNQTGILYNHVAWPHYREITPQIEAQWVNCCRILRITQEQAGIAVDRLVPEDEFDREAPQCILNAAVTLSAMRRMQMQTQTLTITDVPRFETVPPIRARILLGGNRTRYSGFVPGIFEEALTTFEASCSVYPLGGFGGATKMLADAILGPAGSRPATLTPEWHLARNPRLSALQSAYNSLGRPQGARDTAELLDVLFRFVERARSSPAAVLTAGGLTDDETRAMLQTSNMATAVRLVRKGLRQSNKLPYLPA
jgi:hypothetical protein